MHFVDGSFSMKGDHTYGRLHSVNRKTPDQEQQEPYVVTHSTHHILMPRHAKTCCEILRRHRCRRFGPKDTGCWFCRFGHPVGQCAPGRWFCNKESFTPSRQSWSSQSLGHLPTQFWFIFLLGQFRSIHLHFFSKTSPIFFSVLAVANTGSCVGPQNNIGHPVGCRFPCWVPKEYK